MRFLRENLKFSKVMSRIFFLCCLTFLLNSFFLFINEIVVQLWLPQYFVISGHRNLSCEKKLFVFAGLSSSSRWKLGSNHLWSLSWFGSPGFKIGLTLSNLEFQVKMVSFGCAKQKLRSYNNDFDHNVPSHCLSRDLDGKKN